MTRDEVDAIMSGIAPIIRQYVDRCVGAAVDAMGEVIGIERRDRDRIIRQLRIEAGLPPKPRYRVPAHLRKVVEPGDTIRKVIP